MKYIVFFFLIIFVNNNLNAQTPFHNSTVTVGSTTYNCQVVGDHIRVVNVNNTVSDDLAHTLDYYCSRPTIKSGLKDMEMGVKSLFTPARWNELKNMDSFMGIRYYFNMDGTVKEIWFRLRRITILTPAEILAIENKIKSYTMVMDNAACIGVVPFQRVSYVFNFE